MLTLIVAGRNDDYGKDFRQRLFRTAAHNSLLLATAGIQFEYVLAEWNPIPNRDLLSEEFVGRIPNARALVIPAAIHEKYSLNPYMPFHEMAAKNAALRRASGDVVLVANADVLLSEEVVARIAASRWAEDTLYRAHRVDVNPELGWNEMRNPANQLRSGEGYLCPPYYLGAGGDFCLAARSLWHTLRGFNERIRFSTRAKDWQFFLSAAAQDINIDFIGNVYHLDHDGGFRNSTSTERNTEAVHFGRWWDIEFGIPVLNPGNWGFGDLREKVINDDQRITELVADDYVISETQDSLDREISAWLTRPVGVHDTSAAVLLHAVCAAHRVQRNLLCRLTNPALAVTLAGFDAIASRFGVHIHCNWQWPHAAGYTVRPFTPEPRVPRKIDWVLEETNSGVRVYENGSGIAIDVLPRWTPVHDPEFNPVLARRLLNAYLRLQEHGIQQIAIYGAGSHTQQLIQWGVPDDIEVAGIFETAADAHSYVDKPAAAILISSSSFESDMLESCRDHGIHNVVALYTDWPRDMWRIGVTA